MPAKSTTSCPIFKQGLEDNSAQTVSGVKANTAAHTHTGAETHTGVETHTGAETHTGNESFTQVQNGATAGGDNFTRYRVAMASGAALANGDVVVFDSALSTPTSIRVKGSTTADDQAIFGVAAATIASAAYGLIQVYGLHTGVKIDGTTTAVVIGNQIAVGTITKKANVFKNSASGGRLGISLSTVTTGSDSTYTVFIDPR